MGNDRRRITLVARDNQQRQRVWSSPDDAESRLVLLDSLAMLRSTLMSPLVRSDADVARIILDRCCADTEYLSLLAELPREFTGDVLMIRTDGTSFLSATGRGGDRILYALSPDDVEFYLETVSLVPRTEKMERGVLKFHPRIVETANERPAIRGHDLDDTAKIDDAGSRRGS